MKQKITSNYPYKFMDENKWLKEQKQGVIPQELIFYSMYSYYKPVWSSSSDSIYVLRGMNIEKSGELRVVRVDVSTEPLTPEDTIKRYLQALIERNDDYAKSLMKKPEDFFTVSNPHAVGYRIISVKRDCNGYTADVKIFWQYTADAYYSIGRAKYHLGLYENKYLLDDIIGGSEKPYGQLAYEKDGSIYLDSGSGGKKLFDVVNLPKELVEARKHRISCIAYDDASRRLIFTVQFMDQKDGEKIGLLMMLNIAKNELKLVSEFNQEPGADDTAIESLSLSSSGKFAAINLVVSRKNDISSSCLVYDIEKGQGISFNEVSEFKGIFNIRAEYWDGDKLILEGDRGVITQRYVYDSKSGKLKSVF